METYLKGRMFSSLEIQLKVGFIVLFLHLSL